MSHTFEVKATLWNAEGETKIVRELTCYTTDRAAIKNELKFFEKLEDAVMVDNKVLTGQLIHDLRTLKQRKAG